MSTEQKIVYPTQPDEQGFYYENADEQESGFLTRSYDNGGKVKKVVLEDGTEIQVRKLKGRENSEIRKYMGEDESKYFTAGITVAATVNGKKETYEYFEDLWLNEYYKVVAIYKLLNFS